MWSALQKFGRLGAPAGRSLDAQIAALFSDGVIYDPSDFSTLFTDSAGTTPVTSLEQPVGLMKDKSGNNRHAYHTPGDTTTRPTVSRRINLLTKTEQFDDAAWTKRGTAAVTPNAVAAPDGTLTADLIYDLGSLGANDIYQGSANVPTGVALSPSFYIQKVSSTGVLRLNNPASSANGNWSIDLSLVGSGWVQITATHPSVTITTPFTGSGAANGGLQFAATSGGPLSFYIWGTSLVPADLAALPYQRVNTTTDYDTSSIFPTFLRTDGVNDSLQTNTIDFTGTDKMFVGAAVRKLSDAAAGILFEFSANANSNNGSFYLAAPNGASANLGFAIRGSANLAGREASTYAAPISVVESVSLDASKSLFAQIFSIRVNGATPTLANAGNQNIGTGNFGNHKLYLFMRAGTSAPANIWFFGSLIKGATLSASQIALAERWLASKTKTVTLA